MDEPTAGGGGAAAGGAAGGGDGGAPNPIEVSAVKPSPGCGKAATQVLNEFVRATIQTSGVKDAQCADSLNGQPKCGPWSLEREYFVWLPPAYDENEAYPLVIQGSACGGDGKTVYSLSPLNDGSSAEVADNIIRVGITPPPNSIGHGTNPGQGCYDDKEGDDSVELVFFETLLDKLKTELCYDENRVFVSGHNSGAWLANELACKYAGDSNGHAVRAVAVYKGGLPTNPQYTPMCSGKPVAGVFVREKVEDIDPFDGTKFPIARAMVANGCDSKSLDDAQANGDLVDYPIGGGNTPNTCSLIKGCLPGYPLVVCSLPRGGLDGHESVINPAFATFFKDLAAK